MRKGRGAYWGPFLSEEIQRWLAAKEDVRGKRTNQRLAEEADMTAQQIGQIRKHAIKGGTDAAMRLWRPLGYASFDAFSAAAEAWWSEPGRKPPKTMHPGRAEHPRLHERPEWAEVLRLAKLERPEIRDDEAWRMAGDIYDSEHFPSPLTPRLVGNLAYVWLVQLSAAGPKGS